MATPLWKTLYFASRELLLVEGSAVAVAMLQAGTQAGSCRKSAVLNVRYFLKFVI
jgi:hypothetical protein